MSFILKTKLELQGVEIKECNTAIYTLLSPVSYYMDIIVIVTIMATLAIIVLDILACQSFIQKPSWIGADMKPEWNAAICAFLSPVWRAVQRRHV